MEDASARNGSERQSTDNKRTCEAQADVSIPASKGFSEDRGATWQMEGRSGARNAYKTSSAGVFRLTLFRLSLTPKRPCFGAGWWSGVSAGPLSIKPDKGWRCECRRRYSVVSALCTEPASGVKLRGRSQAHFSDDPRSAPEWTGERSRGGEPSSHCS